MFTLIDLQRLAELLKSKKPGDLQEANQLIKNMVKEVPESQPVFASFTSWCWECFRDE